MAKLISYSVGKPERHEVLGIVPMLGIIDMSVSGHTYGHVVTPAGSFESFRYHEVVQKFGDHLAWEIHDPDKAYHDLGSETVTMEEMQRFLDWILESNSKPVN